MSFGNFAVNANVSLTFTIKNLGTAELTNLSISIDGTNAGDFTVTATPTPPVPGPNGSTNFTVRFTPSAAGLRTAALHIGSNDSDETPYDITLTGNGTDLAPPNTSITAGPDGVATSATAMFSFVGSDDVTPPAALTFEVSLETTLSMRGAVPADRLLVTESGIVTAQDVKHMRDHDVHAFLVGETFMRAEDPGAELAKLFG